LSLRGERRESIKREGGGGERRRRRPVVCVPEK
jgi:hypothetical protein